MPVIVRSCAPRVVALLAAVAVVVVATASAELVQVTVIHRHGARTEPVITDTSLHWGKCVLSEEGAKMAISLGTYLRSIYDSFLPTQPELRQVDTRSTDFERTIRTGLGVLKGLFPGPLDMRYIRHRTQDRDILINYFYSWSSGVLRSQGMDAWNDVVAPNVESVLSPQNLTAIGDALGCRSLCRSSPTLCALAGEDVATCRLSNGGLQPSLRALLPKLFDVQEWNNAYLYLNNGTDRAFWARNGPYGLPLAQRIVNNSIAALAGNASGTPYPLLHQYSVHDITIYGLLVAMGAINAGTTDVSLLVPTFASAVIIELHSDATLRFSFASCGQDIADAATWMVYNRVPLNVGCGANATLASECTVSNVSAFLKTMAPTVADPQCFASPMALAMNNCTDVAGVPPTNENCRYFRRNCQAQACPAGTLLDLVTLACKPLPKVNSDDRQMWFSGGSGRVAGFVAVMIVTPLFVGLMLGGLARLRFH